MATDTETYLSRVRIGTCFLYGILVTEKSYHINWQRLVKREHATMLAATVIGDRMPQELIDEVANKLQLVLTEPIEKMWEDDLPYEQRCEKFTLGSRNPTPAESTVSEIISSSNVRYLGVRISKPSRSSGPAKRYIHLSMGPLSHEIRLNMPHDTHPAALRLCYSNVEVISNPCAFVCAYDSRSTNDEIVSDELEYALKGQDGSIPWEDRSVYRMLECVNIEEMIQNWNADDIKQYVEQMKLEVVCVDSDDPFKPHMHLMQQVTPYPIRLNGLNQVG